MTFDLISIDKPNKLIMYMYIIFQGILETFSGAGMMAGPALGSLLYSVSCFKTRNAINSSLFHVAMNLILT